MDSSQSVHQVQPASPPDSHSELAPALQQMGTAIVSPRGTLVFQQGQHPTGVFVVVKGKVRLARDCADGQRTHRTVGRGHILGLLATVSDQPYLKTAEAVEDSELAFVDRNRVMNLLGRRPDFWLQAVAVVQAELKLIRKRVKRVGDPVSASSAITKLSNEN